MKQIKCSRCKRTFEVESDYPFKECPNCHARTVKRFKAIRSYKQKEESVRLGRIIKPLSKKEFISKRKFWFGSNLKGKTVEEKCLIRQEWEREYAKYLEQWHEEYKNLIEKLDKLFRIKSYPIRELECLKVREMAQKHFLEGEQFDLVIFYNHNCRECSRYVNALKNGEFEPKPKDTELDSFWEEIKKASHNEEPINELTKQLYEAMKEGYEKPTRA